MNRFRRRQTGIVDSGAAFAGASGLSGGVARILERLVLRSCPPARYTASQVAEVLGFHEDDIPVLVQNGLLKPLGSPKNNSIKYFSSDDVAALGEDRERMDRAQEFLYMRNRAKSEGALLE